MGTLHYSRLNIRKEDPIRVVFKNRDELRKKANSLKSGRRCVYLVMDDTEIYVTETLELAVSFPMVMHRVTIREFGSFEDAYAVALKFRDGHPLCYDTRYQLN